MKAGSTGIPFKDTGFFSKLIIDYLDKNPDTSGLYNWFPDHEGLQHALQYRLNHPINRETLVNVLKDQYSDLLKPGDVVDHQIQRLTQANTFTVTTGHQLNIFTGPLYTIYKVITIIVLSRKLKETIPQYDFVPVFWLNSEDHDFDEINHLRLFGKELKWDSDQKGPVGMMATTGLNFLLEELSDIMGESDHAKQLSSIFKKAYEQQNLSDASRLLYHELFGEYGLVVLDPNDTRLKRFFCEKLESEFFTEKSKDALDSTIQKITGKYKVQVHPREINLFYLKQGLRERIVRNGETFEVLNTEIRFTETELKSHIATHPEAFSPNVVTRPMFQETILPNIAYVGGGAEVAYWLQFKAMFEEMQVFFPAVLLRSSLLWIDTATQKKMNHLEISVTDDLFKSVDFWIRKFISRNSGSEMDLNSERMAVQDALDKIIVKSEKIDPTLMHSASAERQKIMNMIDHIETKMLRASKKNMETHISQISNIHEKLFPSGKLQERSDSFIPLYLKHGKLFFDTLIESIDPLNPEFLILSENSESVND